MTLVKSLIIAFFIILSPLICSAQGTSVDWKMYGGTTLEESTLCFYESNGIVHQKEGHIQVWTKCLLLSELESFFEKSVKDKGKLYDQLVENSAQKLVKHYSPPFASIYSLTKEELRNIPLYEEEANIASLDPHA